MEGIYYSDYLQLDRVVNAQSPESDRLGSPAHDEMLFIITHQAYELWFKQIIHELKSIVEIFGQDAVEERSMGLVLHRLARVKQIFSLLVDQVDIIETMTPLDFMDFRNLLVPASGFQSLQFKQVEILLGVKQQQRIPADREFFYSRLKQEDRNSLKTAESAPNLFELTDAWLARIPFMRFANFDFWVEYKMAVDRMLASDREIIKNNPTLTEREIQFQLNDLAGTELRFESLLDKEKYQVLREKGEVRFSHQAYLAALFIHLYRDEPILYTSFRYLTLMLDIAQLLHGWRQRHVTMVQRMLGKKIGTGGSSGHEYLKATAERNQVFTDLTNIATFLIPKKDRPELPPQLTRALGFFLSGNAWNSDI